MPTYESKCNKCNKVHKYIARISNYEESAPHCCEVQTKRYFSMGSIPMVNAVSAREFNAYECPVTGHVVTNPKQKHEIEVSNDLIIKEPGMVRKEKQRGYKRPKDHLPDELKPALQQELDKVNATA